MFTWTLCYKIAVITMSWKLTYPVKISQKIIYITSEFRGTRFLSMTFTYFSILAESSWSDRYNSVSSASERQHYVCKLHIQCAEYKLHFFIRWRISTANKPPMVCQNKVQTMQEHHLSNLCLQASSLKYNCAKCCTQVHQYRNRCKVGHFSSLCSFWNADWNTWSLFLFEKENWAKREYMELLLSPR